MQILGVSISRHSVADLTDFQAEHIADQIYGVYFSTFHLETWSSERILANIPEWTEIYLANSEQDVVGYCNIIHTSFGVPLDFLWIDSVAVSPAFQRHKLGKKFLEVIFETYRNCSGIEIC